MKRMEHEQYCAKCSGLGRSPMAKADFDSLDEDQYKKATEGIDDEEGDEEEDDEDEEKSLTLSPDEEELAKSMEYLQATAESAAQDGGQTRLAEASAKAAVGGLEKSEKAELMALLSDEAPGAARPSDDLLKSETAREAFDASAFLEDQAKIMAKSLDALADNQKAFQTMQLEFNRRLARGMDSLSKSLFAERRKNEKLTKSQNELLEKIAGTPVPWKGQVHLTNQDLAKGGRSSQAELDTLQKSSKVSKNTAQKAVSAMFDKAIMEEKDGLAKSLGVLLTNINVTSDDWRRVPGMTPALVEEITRTSVSAG